MGIGLDVIVTIIGASVVTDLPIKFHKAVDLARIFVSKRTEHENIDSVHVRLIPNLITKTHI